MKKNFLILLAMLVVAISGIGGCGSTGPSSGKVATVSVVESGGGGGPITVGKSVQLVATATFSDGTTENVTSQATWSTSNPAVATVTGGVVTAVGPGTATITCVFEGATTTFVVTISGATLHAIAISPANASGGAGTTKQFVAQGTYSDGTVKNISAQVTWSSSSASVATISPAGLLSAVGAGTTTVSAVFSGVTATTTFTVSAATVTSISVTPSNPSLAINGTLQFRALATFSDGTQQDVTSSVTWTSNATGVAAVSSSGLATGKAAGTATITAASGSTTASTTLTITAATLQSISISPSNPSLHAGTSQQFTATGHYSDGSTQNLTTSVTWTSSAPNTVSITSAGLATANSTGPATLTATLGTVTAQVSVTATSATLSSMAVSPSNPSIASGTTQQFKATGTFADGTTQDLTASVIWSSSSTSTATIDANGLATAAGPGTATITATYGSGASGTATTTLTVTPATVASLAVTPSNPAFAVGTETQFTATATYSDGTTQNVTNSVTWTSSTAAVAIDASGLATGEAQGSGTITAAFGGATTSTNVSISAATLTSVAISPNDPSIAAGTSQQFTARGYFSDGSSQDVTSSTTWTSSSNAVSITSGGLATGNSTGSATITGTYQGTAATTSITITPATLISISITPSNPSIAAGTTVQFHATGTYSDGSMQNLTSTLTWSSSSSSVVSISSSGLATGVGQGNANITATSGGVTKSTTIAITAATVESIAITPQTASIAAGTTQQFTATATFSDDSTQDLTTQVTWNSSSSAASINASGVATGASSGSSNITATYSGTTSNSATLTITAATLQTITIAPTSPSAAAGNSVQLTATGHYSDGTTQDLTNIVNWATSDSSTATVSPAGLVTTKKQGTVSITATDGGVTKSVTVNVSSAVLVTLTITPASPSAPSGETQQLTAMGTFSDGSTQNETSAATWASTNSPVANVNSTGLVTAGNPGTATISAAIGSVNTSVTFTSGNAALLSISVTPVNPTVPNGDTQQLTATGNYSDGSQQSLTTSATWSSGASGTASVNSTGLVTAKAVGSAVITATAGGVSGTTTVTVSSATLNSITISPLNPSQPAGSAQQFTASGSYSDGSTQDVTSMVTWSSSNQTAATINSSGVAKTKAQGTTTIGATLSSQSASTTLTVTAAQLTSINVIPSAEPDALHANSKNVGVGAARGMVPNGKIAEDGGLPINLNGFVTTIALGTEQQFLAIGTYTDGSTHDITQTTTWSSSVSGVATFPGTAGLVLATGLGVTTIDATQDGETGATTLNVTAALLTSIAIVPVNPSEPLGTTVQFVATGTFTDGSTEDISSTATWTSSSPATATVSSLGLATTVTPGTTTITCSQGATVNSTTLTVTPAVLLSIAVSPLAPVIPKGLTQQYTATGTYSDGSTHDLTSSVTWSSTLTTIATITAGGNATAVNTGVTTITAQLGLLSGVGTLTVGTAQLQSITVAPPTASIAAGTTQQFIAFGVYSDGTTPIITPLVSWTSSAPAVATVGATGLALGLTSGPTTISASLNGVSGAASLTVDPATLVSISVTPLITTVPLGGTTQYTAIGTFTDLSTQNITSTVAWTTSESAVAVVNNAGLARSSGIGLTTITATSGTISGTATMTVTSATLQLLTVTPGTSTCPAGTTQQMTAEGSYTGGVNLNVTSLVTWSTSSPATATVSASGLVTCISGGSATITATLTLVSGTATVTVTQVTLQSITVTAATPQAILGLLDQMTATGHYSDGSTANITSSVIWSVNPALLAGVSPTGGLLAVGVGNVTVTAVLGSVAGHTTIQLLL